MRVLVLCGGATSERIVSLASGDAVATWAAAIGHDVLKYDPENVGVTIPANRKMAPSVIGVDAPPLQRAMQFSPRVVRGLLDVLEREHIDVVFPILHGGYGEDGTLQSLLEWVGMPYAASGPRSCAIAMHKASAKALMKQAGVPLAKGFEADESELDQAAEIHDRIVKEFGYPAVVKPMSGGSTVGLTIVHSADDLPAALRLIKDQHDSALIEQYFKGKEIAATVVGGVAFPLVEIRPKQGFYDYTNKYTSGKTEYVCPAEISSDLTQAIRNCAADVFRVLGSRGFARVDFLVNESGFICLELNSLPGMTATSLVPKAALAHGWTAEQLIANILAAAWSTSEIATA